MQLTNTMKDNDTFYCPETDPSIPIPFYDNMVRIAAQNNKNLYQVLACAGCYPANTVLDAYKAGKEPSISELRSIACALQCSIHELLLHPQPTKTESVMTETEPTSQESYNTWVHRGISHGLDYWKFPLSQNHSFFLTISQLSDVCEIKYCETDGIGDWSSTIASKSFHYPPAKNSNFAPEIVKQVQHVALSLMKEWVSILYDRHRQLYQTINATIIVAQSDTGCDWYTLYGQDVDRSRMRFLDNGTRLHLHRKTVTEPWELTVTISNRNPTSIYVNISAEHTAQEAQILVDEFAKTVLLNKLSSESNRV